MLCRRNIIIYITSVLIFLSKSFSSYAQPATIPFKHLSLNEGLSQSPVFTLLQDHKGFVWIGNREGLIKFDGYNFKKYFNRNLKKLNAIHNDIRTIFEDRTGNLWLGTSSGVCLFNPQTEVFTQIEFNDLPFVYSIISQGSALWVATSAGLRCIDNKTRKSIALNLHGQGRQQLLTKRVNTLYCDKSGLVWAGTDQGVVCFEPKSGQTKTLPAALQQNTALKQAKVFAIKQDADGDIWLGTENMGLFWYKSKPDSCVHYDHIHAGNGLLSNFIRDIYVYDRYTVWIGTRNGLNIFDKRTHRFTGYTHDAANPISLSHNTIWNFMKDKAGSLWLATYAGGVNIYNPANANFYNIGEKVNNNIGLNEPLVNAVLPLPGRNALLVGTDGGGLNYINRQQKTIKVFSVKDPASERVSDIVKSLAIDASGRILVGTLEGLAILNLQDQKVKYFNFHKDANALIRVNTLLADSGQIWVGTERNGLKLIKADGTYESFMHGDKGTISDNYITALCKGKIAIWAGTRDGLNCYQSLNKSFTSYFPNTGSSASRIILSLCFDRHQRLWVGSGDGLFLFDDDKKQFLPIGAASKLKGQVIQAITEDDQGNIWTSTFNGLFRITVGAGNVRKYQVVNYTANDGLASNQFSAGAVAREGGELFFGGVNGISAFFPTRLIKNGYQPPVMITGLMINNNLVTPQIKNSPLQEPIQDTKTLNLAYNQNHLSFSFAALSFLNPQNNQYAYEMDGLTSHEGWHYCGTQRTANYTNLEPGRYTFSVKATNNDGIWSSQITSIIITIAPPYWKTWWAYLIYLLVFALTLYIIIRFFHVRAQLKRDLFYEHVEHERHQELNRMKLEFFTNVSHELRTPLTLIAGPVENIIRNTAPTDAHYPQLQFIKNNAGRLLKLVSELLDFRKAESGSMGVFVTGQNIIPFLHGIFLSFEYMATAASITYEFIHEQEEVEVYFDDVQLEKVIYNLLVNAFKVTPNGGRVVLKVVQLPQTVEISISDSGCGISPEKQEKLFTTFYQVNEVTGRSTGTGIGLALAKSIVDLHQGKLSINSSTHGLPGNLNTSFTVSLQLGKTHFSERQLQTQFVPDAMPVHSLTQPNTEVSMEAMPESGSTPEAVKKHSVLIVEDNEELRAFLNYSLNAQYNVNQSANGLQGWQAATELIPDVIISDVMMPEMDGLQLTSKLKTDERTSHIPVILLTARSSQAHHMSGLETGADIYLTKPFNAQMLELQINNLLNTRSIWQQKYSQQVTLEPQHIQVNGPDQKFLSKLLTIIEGNIENESFGVPTLAAEIGMSQPVLYKKVKALTNMSVNDFVKSIRLKKAAQLLAQKGHTVYEVAYAVGFSDSKYFSKEFAKQFGVTPSAYKNNPTQVQQD